MNSNYKEVKIECEGKNYLLRLYPLEKSPGEKENNRIEVYELTKNKKKLLVTFHEVWNLSKPLYYLEAFPEPEVSDEFAKEWVRTFLPLPHILSYSSFKINQKNYTNPML